MKSVPGQETSIDWKKSASSLNQMDRHQHPFAWYEDLSSHPRIPQDPKEASLTSTVPNQVQELLFLAAGLTAPTGESEVGVAGDTV